MEVEKLCRNCKYLSTNCDDEPCKSCKCKSNWVDASKYEDFRTGDIVTIGYSRDIYVYLCNNLIIPIQDDMTIDPTEAIAIAENIKEPSITCKYRIVAGIGILSTKIDIFIKFARPVAMYKVHYATAADITEHNAATCSKNYFLSDWIKLQERVNNMDKIKDLNTLRDFKAGDIVKEIKGIKNIYIYLRDNLVLRVPYHVTVSSSCIISPCRNYMINKLIANNTATWISQDELEYASPEIITEHDNIAKLYYVTETLNEWFSNLINKEPKKINETFTLPKRSTTDPNTVYKYKPKGARYDKFPTLNANFIKRVIFSDPATIVFWEDGTKTVVKTQDGEKYDKEKGLAMAISKRVFGNERDYYNVFKRWMRKGEDRHEET